jgi:outer membrane protein OmpA-like peptidoglycan-associated protein
MKTLTRLLLGTAAIALAGCTNLPGSSLGATFGAERYLKADHGGPGFEGALAKEYTEVARRAAFQDVLWMNSTAYIAKAQQAEAGTAPAPWSPDQLGVNGDASAMYDSVVAMINDNKAERPEACARAQVMWDQYLEALRGGDTFCITPADARALLDEALAACAPPVPSAFIVYFGFNQTNLTDRAIATIDEVVGAVQSMGATALSLVGHTDTVGSRQYNQGLSERRARRVAEALVDRGIPSDSMTLAGRSFDQPAVDTGPNVREPLNRRVEITLSK